MLDTGAGKPADGVLIVLYRGDMFMAETRTDDDGRAKLAENLDPGAYRLVFHPPSPFFKRVELEVELGGGPLPRPAPRLALLVRELPRQLSADELTPLFSGRTRLVEELAARENPLEVAEEVALALPRTIRSQRSRPIRGSASRRRSSAAPSRRCWPSWSG